LPRTASTSGEKDDSNLPKSYGTSLRCQMVCPCMPARRRRNAIATHRQRVRLYNRWSERVIQLCGDPARTAGIPNQHQVHRALAVHKSPMTINAYPPIVAKLISAGKAI